MLNQNAVLKISKSSDKKHLNTTTQFGIMRTPHRIKYFLFTKEVCNFYFGKNADFYVRTSFVNI